MVNWVRPIARTMARRFCSYIPSYARPTFIYNPLLPTVRFTNSGRRIITYVLLCGYSPFRSEDVKDLVRETTAAKVEFHARYWGNVSDQGTHSSILHPEEHP